jgi:hypothetical protein
MASSYSTDLKIELMVTGENAGTWGDKTNANLNVVQQAIAGFEAISIAGGAQTTNLLIQNSPEIANSKARNAVIKLTGTITGNQVVTVPTGIEKTYIVENGTSGAFTVEFKQDGGTGTTFATTDKGIKFLYANGTNIIDINANLSASSFEQINLPTQNELRFEDASGGQYIAFRAGTTISSNLTFTLPTADGSSGQALTTNGSGVLSFATSAVNGAVNWNTTKITANPNPAVTGVGYFCDTSGGAFTVTLPAAPSAGAIVALSDYTGTWGTNNVTVGRNSSNINGAAENLILNVNNTTATLIYVDATEGWRVIDTGSLSGVNSPQYVAATGGTITTCGDYKIHTFTGPGTFTVTSAGNPLGSASVDYMVVAGGGGAGGGIGGGGGAGGFRESVPSPAAWTASPLANPGGAIPVSVTGYPITIGSGGIGTGGGGGINFPGPSVNTQPASTPGSPSIFSTITSTGGGYGRHYASQPSPTQSGPGGSGGGGSGNVSGTGGTGNTPPTSPSQGNTGGNGNPNPPWSAAGGGGATAVGSDFTPSGSGPGGAGATTSISGSPTAYAGGGGGGGSNYGNPPGGTGGTGGGGNGQPGSPPSSGQNGTANRGGGGGGGAQWSCQQSGYNGGSGIIVIRYKFQ